MADSKKDIYGRVPVPDEAETAISEAMSDLKSSSSNTVNGPIKSKSSEYPEEG